MHSKLLKKLIEEEQNETTIFDLLAVFQRKEVRNEKFVFRRIDWEHHLQMCRATNGFKNRYGMTEEAFNELQQLLSAPSGCSGT